MIQFILAFLLYPGLLFVCALGLVFVLLLEGPNQAKVALQSLVNVKAWQSGEGLLTGLSMLLAAVGLVFLPWPFHPMDLSSEPGIWILAWGALEGAFLLALLPGLIAGSPPVVRSAIREGQAGVAGRTLLWLAMAIALLLHQDWTLAASHGYSPLLNHILALLASAFALPIAIGWGPFHTETGLAPGGIEQGLDRDTTRLVHSVRGVRTAALIAAALVALMPVSVGPPAIGVVMVLTAFLTVTLVLNKFTGMLPRLSLAQILRTCWWRVLPLAMAALLYLVVR